MTVKATVHRQHSDCRVIQNKIRRRPGPLQALGCYGDYVEDPADLGPALQRAQAEVDQGRVAVVNVKTDEMARATTMKFAQYAI